MVLDNYFRTRRYVTKDGDNNRTVATLKIVTVAQACHSRDTFLQRLYEALVEFMVETLNGVLSEVFAASTSADSLNDSQGIHVLDIAGYENYLVENHGNNGLHQLCTNYWSEKVRSLFIDHIGASDLGDGRRHVFGDGETDDCVALFENEPFGIFSLLDDHSKAGRPNDEDFVATLFATNDGVRGLSRPDATITTTYVDDGWRTTFTVEHFCGKIQYSAKGLVRKNVRQFSATCVAIMRSSTNSVLRAVGKSQASAASRRRIAGTSQSVCSHERQQADGLLTALSHAGQHFMTCVKPSALLAERVFDSAFVLQQIRELRLVHQIQASHSSSSPCVRLTQNHFWRRHRSLSLCTGASTLRSLLSELSAKGVLDLEQVVVDQADICLTSRQWNQLKLARSSRLNADAIVIQRNLAPHSTTKNKAMRSVQDLQTATRTNGADVAGPLDQSVHGGEERGSREDSLRENESGTSHDDEDDASAFWHFERLRNVGSPLSWDRHALPQSLLALDDLCDCRLALSIDRCVRGYMRDSVVAYRSMLAQFILRIGTTRSGLANEIYLQLMKQLTKNPRRDSSLRGWSLLAMCVGSFPPSQALAKCVEQFLTSQTNESTSFWRLVRNFASFSLKKLKNPGTSASIPPVVEIRMFDARFPFLASIELVDGTPVVHEFSVTPELTANHLVGVCARLLGLDERLTKYLGLYGAVTKPTTSESNDPVIGGANIKSRFFRSLISSSTPAWLHGDGYLGDKYEIWMIRGCCNVKFQLKIRLHPSSHDHDYWYSTDELFEHLLYLQVQDDFVKGHLPRMDENTALELASLAIAVDCEGGGRLPHETDVDVVLDEYLPLEWRHAARSRAGDWATRIAAFWREELVITVAGQDEPRMPTTRELQRMYMDAAARHRLVVASYFPCRLTELAGSSKRELGLHLSVEMPKYLVLGVNGDGMAIIDRTGTVLVVCAFGDLLQWGGPYNQFRITLTTPAMAATSIDLVVATKDPEELSALLRDYKNAATKSNEPGGPARVA